MPGRGVRGKEAKGAGGPRLSGLPGILKQMLDTMEKDLSDATAAEEEAKTNFEARQTRGRRLRASPDR